MIRRFLIAIVSAMPFCLAISPVQSQPPAKPIEAPYFFGNAMCSDSGCHGSPTKEKYDASIDYLKRSDVYTSRKVEALIWYEKDKHKDATRVLTNERSNTMAKILGLKKSPLESKECLSCHGVYIEEGKDKYDPDTFSTQEQRIDSGVSCVSCHGSVKKWLREHYDRFADVKWRNRSREEKIHQFGMTDLWDPVTRAQLCFSCHIGDAAQGKIVTHEMYAAGHPPLPGIEVTTFSEGMPAHWESFSQKIVRARYVDEKAKTPKERELVPGLDFIRKAFGVNPDKEEMEQTRMVILTSLVALKTNVTLMTDEAKLSEKHADLWPQLANYDCYACHHELRSKSWRLDRKPQGPPGRPMPRSWTTPLAKWAFNLGAATPAGGYDEALKAWNDAFRQSPFGRPAEIARVGPALIAKLDERIAQLRAMDLNQPAARAALVELVKSGSLEDYDFEQARQLAWASRTIVNELESIAKSKYVPAGRPKLSPPYDALYKTLDDELVLTLPEGQAEIVPRILDPFLKRNAAYDPLVFRRHMSELNKHIQSK